MSKNFYKYLPFLTILFLTGVANLHASQILEDNNGLSNIDAFETSNQISVHCYLDSVCSSSSRKENKNRLPVEIAEIAEIEEIEEELNPKKNLFSFKSFVATFSNAQLPNHLSEPQNDISYYKIRFSPISTRLYVKFQVFII